MTIRFAHHGEEFDCGRDDLRAMGDSVAAESGGDHRRLSVPRVDDVGESCWVAHGWDLAQALGRPADLPQHAAEESLAFARADGRAVRRGGGCFGPARQVADAAPAIVRLVAFLGRDVPAT